MKQGWTYRQLKDVTNKISDGSHNPPKGIAYSDYPMLSSKNILFDDFNYDSPRYLSKEDFDIENKRTDISDGDVLLTIVGTVGRTCCVQNPFIPFTLQRSVAVLKPKKEILISRFLMYALYSLSDLWENEAKGAAQKGVYLKQLAAVSIPTPPLPEQEQIVERLDAAFAQIDELKSNAERQLAEARALFQSALTQAMQPKPGWQEKRIKEIADVKGGKRVPKGYKLQSTKTNHPYIRVADFNNYGTIEMSDIQYISNDIFEQIKNYTITDKDLYVSIAGTIGKTGIIPSELNGANLTENACKLVFKEDINLRFVYLFTLSEIFKKQVEKATKQASQPKLALTRLAEVKISIPSITEQQIIVEHLDALSNHVKELEEISRKTAAECAALKQALLRQIFE